MSQVSEDLRFTALCDHYRDTIHRLDDFLKRRERLLISVLVVVTLMLFQVYSPRSAVSAIGESLCHSLGLASAPDPTFIGTVIWFVLLGVVLRYFQIVVYVERQYAYIHRLEAGLNRHYDGPAFTREGASYLDDYPHLSKWSHSLYTYVFPVLLVLAASVRACTEISGAPGLRALLVLDTLMWLAVVVSTVLYLHVRIKAPSPGTDAQVALGSVAPGFARPAPDAPVPAPAGRLSGTGADDGPATLQGPHSC